MINVFEKCEIIFQKMSEIINLSDEKYLSVIIGIGGKICFYLN